MRIQFPHSLSIQLVHFPLKREIVGLYKSPVTIQRFLPSFLIAAVPQLCNVITSAYLGASLRRVRSWCRLAVLPALCTWIFSAMQDMTPPIVFYDLEPLPFDCPIRFPTLDLRCPASIVR